MGDVHRFQGRLLPHTHTKPTKEISENLSSGQKLSVQSTTIWPVHSSLAVHCSDQRGQTHGFAEGYKDPTVPTSVGPGHVQPTCFQHTQTPVALCQDLAWLVNMGKSELDSKQVFDFKGFQFDLKEGKVRPTLDRWGDTDCKIRLMSLIGLLTATEKQVHLGLLHMTPTQWYLKNNGRVPESLEVVIPVPRLLHPHLKWWLEESNVLQGQPLHPLQYALLLSTDAS